MLCIWLRHCLYIRDLPPNYRPQNSLGALAPDSITLADANMHPTPTTRSEISAATMHITITYLNQLRSLRESLN